MGHLTPTVFLGFLWNKHEHEMFQWLRWAELSREPLSGTIIMVSVVSGNIGTLEHSWTMRNIVLKCPLSYTYLGLLSNLLNLISKACFVCVFWIDLRQLNKCKLLIYTISIFVVGGSLLYFCIFCTEEFVYILYRRTPSWVSNTITQPFHTNYH